MLFDRPLVLLGSSFLGGCRTVFAAAAAIQHRGESLPNGTMQSRSNTARSFVGVAVATPSRGHLLRHLPTQLPPTLPAGGTKTSLTRRRQNQVPMLKRNPPATPALTHTRYRYSAGTWQRWPHPV